jgi:hypothetical protein
MKTTLDDILEYYENKKQTQNTTVRTVDIQEPPEATYELCEYLFGNGDIQHLYNYYNILDESRGIEW